MNHAPPTSEWQCKRQRAVKTALLLGLLAVLIFVAFIASSIMGL